MALLDTTHGQLLRIRQAETRQMRIDDMYNSRPEGKFWIPFQIHYPIIGQSQTVS